MDTCRSFVYARKIYFIILFYFIDFRYKTSLDEKNDLSFQRVFFPKGHHKIFKTWTQISQLIYQLLLLNFFGGDCSSMKANDTHTVWIGSGII